MIQLKLDKIMESMDVRQREENIASHEYSHHRLSRLVVAAAVAAGALGGLAVGADIPGQAVQIVSVNGEMLASIAKVLQTADLNLVQGAVKHGVEALLMLGGGATVGGLAHMLTKELRIGMSREMRAGLARDADSDAVLERRRREMVGRERQSKKGSNLKKAWQDTYWQD